MQDIKIIFEASYGIIQEVKGITGEINGILQETKKSSTRSIEMEGPSKTIAKPQLNSGSGAISDDLVVWRVFQAGSQRKSMESHWNSQESSKKATNAIAVERNSYLQIYYIRNQQSYPRNLWNPMGNQRNPNQYHQIGNQTNSQETCELLYEIKGVPKETFGVLWESNGTLKESNVKILKVKGSLKASHGKESHEPHIGKQRNP